MRNVDTANVPPVTVSDYGALFGTVLVLAFLRPDGIREIFSLHALTLCVEATGPLIRENARHLRRVTKSMPSHKYSWDGCSGETTSVTAWDEHGWQVEFLHVDALGHL